MEKVVALFVRTGYSKFAGYLAGGLTAWNNAGLPIHSLPAMPVHELAKHLDDVTVLDVRSPEEWKHGHIPGATHRFLPDLREKRKWPKKTKPIVTYCASGYRASLAASWLQAKGFKDIRNVPGSWQAWRNAGLPVEKTSAAKGARP